MHSVQDVVVLRFEICQGETWCIQRGCKRTARTSPIVADRKQKNGMTDRNLRSCGWIKRELKSVEKIRRLIPTAGASSRGMDVSVVSLLPPLTFLSGADYYDC